MNVNMEAKFIQVQISVDFFEPMTYIFDKKNLLSDVIDRVMKLPQLYYRINDNVRFNYIINGKRFYDDDLHLTLEELQDEFQSPLKINFSRVYRHGGCCTENLSSYIGDAETDIKILSAPLRDGPLRPRYVRSTNVTGVYKQKTGNCFVYAAVEAYLNTAIRIYGHRKLPSFSECYKIADYNHGKSGQPDHAIHLLEEHFHLGILCKKTMKRPTIREILTLSIIISFTTSKQGYRAIANGSLTEFPGGPTDGWHATLLEGYDLDQDLCICKNSWGKFDEAHQNGAHERFDLDIGALHDFEIVKVYWTLNSIQGKTIQPYKENMEKFKGELKGKTIDCAWMDEVTACYNTDYVAEFHPGPEEMGPLNYLGYDIDQWISITLNRTEMTKEKIRRETAKEEEKQKRYEQSNESICLLL